MKLRWSLIVLILLGATATAYLNALPNGFVWDDVPLVIDNSHVRNWSFFGPAFTTDLFHNYKVTVVTHYRPLQTASLILDYRLWGHNPFGYHLTNVLLHFGCVLLIAVVVFHLTRSQSVALIVATLFAVHPINTNAITYIAGRADPLAFLFMLLSLLLYVLYRQPKPGAGKINILWFVGSTLAYVAALFSRENAMLFPLLIATCEFCLFPSDSRRLQNAIRATLPYLLLMLAFAYWRHQVLVSLDKPTTLASALPLSERFLISFRALATYVGLLIWPVHLQMERQLQMGGSILQVLAVFGFLCLVGLVGVIVWARRRSPLILFGSCWFLLTLVPLTGLLSLNASVAEHWLYVPSVGAYLVFAVAFIPVLHRFPKWAAFAFVAISVALALRTARRNQDWINPTALYAATKAAAPYSTRVRVNLAQELKQQGRLSDAQSEMETSEQMEPAYVRTKTNLAALYQASGDLTKARAKIEQCLQLEPDNTIALLRAATIAEELRDLKHVEVYFIRALATTTDVSVRIQYGSFLLKQKKYLVARSMANECLALEPGNADGYNLLGAICVESGDDEQAEASFLVARKLDRHSPDADINLGRLAARRGDLQAAANYFRHALLIQPDDVRALYQLATVHWRAGQHDLAQECLNNALELAPKNPQVLTALERLRRGDPWNPAITPE